MYLLLTVPSACCCMGFSLVAVRRLLFAALLLSNTGSRMHRLRYLWTMGSVVAASWLQSAGSVVVAHGLHCSAAGRIFPDQGLNLCILHWQTDSLPLSHQGNSKNV